MKTLSKTMSNNILQVSLQRGSMIRVCLACVQFELTLRENFWTITKPDPETPNC